MNNGWLSPSENMTTPLWKDTIWQDHIRPKLQSADLGWVNFQVLRRTAIALARDKKAELKDLAGQSGHSEDVTANVYNEAALGRKIELAEILESAPVIN